MHLHFFALLGMLVGLGFRAFGQGWRSSSLGVTLATTGVSVVGSCVAALLASALSVEGEFLSLAPATVLAAVGGAFAAVGLLGSPEATPSHSARESLEF